MKFEPQKSIKTTVIKSHLDPSYSRTGCTTEGPTASETDAQTWEDGILHKGNFNSVLYTLRIKILITDKHLQNIRHVSLCNVIIYR